MLQAFLPENLEVLQHLHQGNRDMIPYDNSDIYRAIFAPMQIALSLSAVLLVSRRRVVAYNSFSPSMPTRYPMLAPDAGSHAPRNFASGAMSWKIR